MILVLKVKVLKKEKCYLISKYVKELQMYLKTIDKNINRSIENKRNTLYVIYYIRIKGIFRWFENNIMYPIKNKIKKNNRVKREIAGGIMKKIIMILLLIIGSIGIGKDLNQYESKRVFDKIIEVALTGDYENIKMIKKWQMLWKS